MLLLGLAGFLSLSTLAACNDSSKQPESPAPEPSKTASAPDAVLKHCKELPSEKFTSEHEQEIWGHEKEWWICDPKDPASAQTVKDWAEYKTILKKYLDEGAWDKPGTQGCEDTEGVLTNGTTSYLIRYQLCDRNLPGYPDSDKIE